MYGSLLGKGFNPDAVSDGLGGPGPLRIQQNYFKLHACCLYNIPALDGMQHILSRETFSAPMLTVLTCWPRRWRP